MKKTLISQNKFKVMPWKNNSGITAEIDIFPENSDFKDNNFKWRVSSAQIHDENKFSNFPGYDRLLTVVSGDGLLLNGEELAPFNIFRFAGEEEVFCSLIENPVEDLGIIFKRDQFEASIEILEIKHPETIKISNGVHFFMAIAKPLEIEDVSLESPNFLKIEDGDSLRMSSAEYPNYVLKVSIDQKLTH